MPVKSYKLKIVFPPDRPDIREWLWTTHLIFNKGVKYLLHQLFLMRRGKGWTRRGKNGSNEFVPNQELIDRFVRAGKTEKEAEELAEACRQIYEHNFPKSGNGDPDDADSGDDDQEGGAQAARGLYGPLTNPESTGLGLAGLERIAKNLRKAIGFPESVKDPDSIRFESGGRSPAHYNIFCEWQSKGMKKNSSLRQKFIDKAESYLKANVDESELLFRKNLQRVREALGGRVFSPVAEHLKLLPDDESGFGEEMSPEWELGMFTQAFERLLTHEGWVSRRRKEKEEQEREIRFKLEGGWEHISEKDERNKKSPKRIPSESAPGDPENWRRVEGAKKQSWYLRLRKYEEERTVQDGLSSRQGSREKIGIDGGMTKGWGRMRPLLLKALGKGQSSKEQLTQVLNRYQAENPTRFGDGRLFRWLLEDENRSIWTEEKDRLREYQRLKPRPMRSITWTDPDPRFHPLWTRYGPSSAVPYALDKKLGSVTLKLLVPHPSKPGFFAQKTVRGISLAPYGKFHSGFNYLGVEDSTKTGKKGKKKDSVGGATELAYSDNFLSSASATTKGARLMFDRRQMERAGGEASPVEAFLNFSCEINAPETVPWERDWLYSTRLQFENPLRKEVRQAGFSHYLWPYSLLVDGRKKLDVKNGVRILSIDLGLRHGAAWALWGLSLKDDSYHSQTRSMAVVQAGASEEGEVVHAHLIGRGLLDLPGEGAELPGETKDLKEQIWAIKRDLNINKQLLWAASKLVETGYATIERKESFKKRKSGKGFRHKWTAIKTQHDYSPEQLQANAVDAAEALLELRKNEDIRKELADLPWPSLEAPEDEAARKVFVECVREKRSEVASLIFQPQKSLKGLSRGSRKTVYQKNSIFWKRDMALMDRVRALWKKMREKRKNSGGLSSGRLAVLADFYDLLKAWTFRPRRPGERRHMSEDQGFAIRDRDHLQALKDDRIKKLSFLITARALGYEPDLMTGLWKYIGADGEVLWQRPESGEFYSDNHGNVTVRRPKEVDEVNAKRPHPVGPPCHLIVFENLTRYRFRQDRPKNENSQLMKWSHREIFHFTRQAAQLYGVRTAMAYAAFSSQYCSFCGAAGSRVQKAPGDWFQEDGQPVSWLKRMMDQKDDKGNPTDKARELSAIKPGDWISWVSGEHFLCSNERCQQGKAPVNADENAASNIGRRFLQGVPPDFRLTCESASEGVLRVKNGDWKGKLLKSVPGISWVLSEEKVKPRKVAKREVAEEREDEMEPGEDGVKILFTDSVSFKGKWMESKIFWGQVRQRVGKRLQTMK